ncbi:hypothetical protein D7D52_20220 [Nocardia yunnanensis]|uniref:Uncharacterized protein n=1 Tax=Nocardia yunnanensis TaxID=2382165 RepID=A0A386ZE12_9NOCA|nr:hypothetical protein [Nocardia yunnanensis]AYF75780.1 hypothetical protein D7D52_20220 [Nocardia yunnanensis]
MHTFHAIAKSLGEVTLIALILGVGVPVVFATGIRLWAAEPAADGPRTTQRTTVADTLAAVCFAAAALVVAAGILYIAKDFISHTFDIQLFGAKPPKK